jgi:hypothetical protein
MRTQQLEAKFSSHKTSKQGCRATVWFYAKSAGTFNFMKNLDMKTGVKISLIVVVKHQLCACFVFLVNMPAYKMMFKKCLLINKK